MNDEFDEILYANFKNDDLIIWIVNLMKIFHQVHDLSNQIIVFEILHTNEFFFSCHYVHVKTTLNDDRRYYKKRNDDRWKWLTNDVIV